MERKRQLGWGGGSCVSSIVTFERKFIGEKKTLLPKSSPPGSYSSELCSMKMGREESTSLAEMGEKKGECGLVIFENVKGGVSHLGQSGQKRERDLKD